MYGILIALLVISVDIIRIRSRKYGLDILFAILCATLLYMMISATGFISFEHLLIEWLLTFFLLINFYIIKTGIDDVSPTLLIYRMIDSQGTISVNELENLFMSEKPTQKRLNILVRDGFVE